MQNTDLNLNKDYEYIKKELMPFIDENEKDQFFDAFLKLAIY